MQPPPGNGQASPLIAEFVTEVLSGPAPPAPAEVNEKAAAQAAEKASYSTIPPPVNRPAAPAPIPPYKMVDETGPNTALLAAVDKVYRVVAQQIAFHEREAKKLRDALIPFTTFRAAEAAPTQTAEAYIHSLLETAASLQEKQ